MRRFGRQRGRQPSEEGEPGPLGNSIVGILGGGVGGQILGMLTGGAAAAAGGLDIGSIISSVSVGALGEAC